MFITLVNETSGQQWNKFVFIAINKHIDQKARETYVSKKKKKKKKKRWIMFRAKKKCCSAVFLHVPQAFDKVCHEGQMCKYEYAHNILVISQRS